jgi:hypothetical protein
LRSDRLEDRDKRPDNQQKHWTISIIIYYKL